MRDNKPVNDIFQNDGGSKNKTKTILLLTIVAIILISVFLIIAWVMTRDNPLQEMQNQNKNESVMNETKSQTLPYAHNLDSQNPLGLDTTKDLQKPQEDENQASNPMSSIPPLGVPTDIAPIPATDAKPKDNELENDARFQAALRDLEKQHNDKKNTESKKPEPVATDPVKPKEMATKPKDSEKVENKKPNDNIIPKPQNNVVSANQGKAPEQGYYLQVGVFTQTPTQSFLNKIAKYNYRILKMEEDGVIKSKYLIGPYISRNKAKEFEQKVREEVESKANVIFYQRQAK